MNSSKQPMIGNNKAGASKPLRQLNIWIAAAIFAIFTFLGVNGSDPLTSSTNHRPISDVTIDTPFPYGTIDTTTTTITTIPSYSPNISNSSSSNSPSLSTMLGLNGTVSECCCSFTDIENTNLQLVRPLLQQVVQTPFFAHFKIDLCTNCELWDDQPMCMLRDCGVCECDAPPRWAADVEDMPLTGPSPSSSCGGGQHVEDQVVTTVDDRVSNGWLQGNPSSFLEDEPPIGAGMDSPLEDEVDEGDSTAVVVDLRLNPEQYTGYSGASAAKVWSAIHTTNCFQPPSPQPQPFHNTNNTSSLDPKYCILPPSQRLYNRFLSGLHSSISLHIAHTYCLQLDPTRMGECAAWGTNPTLAHERVLHHPDRVENLYVAFALLLRAVVKAGPAVTAAVPMDDPFFADSASHWNDLLLPELTRMAESCPKTFDERSLWMEPGFRWEKVELQRRFRELQGIMECVGCDRCKLWGTLQTLGVGTAMRVLFYEEEEVGGGGGGVLELSRQEAVALVHTLERLSSALVFAHDLRTERER